MPHFGIPYLSPAEAIARLASVIVMALVSLVIVSASVRSVAFDMPRPDSSTVSPGLAS